MKLTISRGLEEERQERYNSRPDAVWSAKSVIIVVQKWLSSPPDQSASWTVKLPHPSPQTLSTTTVSRCRQSEADLDWNLKTLAFKDAVSRLRGGYRSITLANLPRAPRSWLHRP